MSSVNTYSATLRLKINILLTICAWVNGDRRGTPLIEMPNASYDTVGASMPPRTTTPAPPPFLPLPFLLSLLSPSLRSSTFPSLSLPSHPLLPSLPRRNPPSQIQLEGLGERCELPQRALAAKAFWAGYIFRAQNLCLHVATIFVLFLC